MFAVVKKLDAIRHKEKSSAGGKGSSLGEMIHHGIPVPPGFVVVAEAFHVFLTQSGLRSFIDEKLRILDVDNEKSLEKISKSIIAQILHTEIPSSIEMAVISAFVELGSPFVAVRSSATLEDSESASWAGELETFLNTQKPDLLVNVRKCWASLFSPRALFYQHEHAISGEDMSVAVVVQSMVQSDVSGVCFTVHPVTGSKNEMVIEAVFGLGEAIVSGITTPDTYIFDKKKRATIQCSVSEQSCMIVKSGRKNLQKKVPKNIANTQKLTLAQISQLAQLCRDIETYYKKPQDIEWALYKGKFYILQARPITTC